ncbi:hypothetical protein KAR48_18655 [bacterium]|nr:hypothetical protein [bacterium]
MIERIMNKFGIDYIQLKAILSVSLKIDIRGHRISSSRQKKRISPFILSLIFYFFMSVVLAVNLATRSTVMLYSVFCMAYAQIMCVFLILLEFGHVLISPDDVDILGYRPLNSRTYFLSRFLNLLVYVMLTATALNLPPALIGMSVFGIGWHFAPIYLIISFIACVASAALVVWVYAALLRYLPYQRFKDILAILQTSLSFVAFLAYQMIPRMSRQYLDTGVELSGEWLWLIPSAWFSGVLRLMVGQGQALDWGLSALAILSTLFLSVIAFRKISLDYSMQISRLQIHSRDLSRKQGRLNDRGSWISRHIKNIEVRAGYELGLAMLRRDRQVKMTVYPLLGMPLAFLILALVENQIVNPLASADLPKGGFAYMALFFIFFMLHSLVQTLLYSKDWEAAWIMIAAPVASPGNLLKGIIRVIIVRCIAPFFVILSILYSRAGSWDYTLLFMLFIASCSAVFMAADMFFIKNLPFSKPRERGDRAGQFALMLFAVPFFGVMAGLFIIISKWPVSIYLMIITGFILFSIIESRAIRRLNKLFS